MPVNPPENLPRQAATRRIAVRVMQKAVPAIRSGHPWLFEDSVKKAPSDASPAVAVLPPGTPLKTLSRHGPWRRVESPKAIGWTR